MRSARLLGSTVVLLITGLLTVGAAAATERLPDSARQGPPTDASAGLRSFPSSPTGRSSSPQGYDVEYRFFNRDIGGTTLSSTLITADYTRCLDGGEIRWNDVRLASAIGADEPTTPGEHLSLMEGFRYGVSDSIVQESFYDEFPSGDLRDLIKTMVWDGMLLEMFDGLAPGFHELRLNSRRHVSECEDFVVQMCEWGSILMRDLDVEWSGVSRVNDEACAVVLFQSFSNPVDAPGLDGRSCYWGQVWFSTSDLEIERLTMNEDVVLEIASPGTPPLTMNIQRQVEFRKHA